MLLRASFEPLPDTYSTYCPPPEFATEIDSPGEYVPPFDFPLTERAVPCIGDAPIIAAQVPVAHECTRASEREDGYAEVDLGNSTRRSPWRSRMYI